MTEENAGGSEREIFAVDMLGFCRDAHSPACGREDSVGCGENIERLACSAESWLDLVQNFRERFRTAAGLAKSPQCRNLIPAFPKRDNFPGELQFHCGDS